MKIKIFMWFMVLCLFFQINVSATEKEVSQQTTDKTADQYRTYYLQRAHDQKKVYLTFDDGPSKYTAAILSILKKHHIHATFFFIGNNLKKFEGIVHQTYNDGHYIGLHSMTHDYKKLYGAHSAKRFLQEMKTEQKMIASILPTVPTLIRSPYGTYPNFTAEHRHEVIQEGFKVWDWTVDSLDWKYSDNPNHILQVVFTHLSRKQEVILLHERKQTVQVLEELIVELKQKGYYFEVYQPSQHFPLNFYDDMRM